MNFKAHLNLPDVITINPKLIEDSRGYFLESFRLKEFTENCGNYNFVQENESFSRKGTIRGLHYQLIKPQGKLVKVNEGAIFDVAIDIRKNSKNFGNWSSEILSYDNHKQLWIPPGFAHGFLVLSDIARVSYKCTDYYFPQGDRSIIWSDKDINISWPDIGMKYIISEKDSKAKLLSESEISE